VLLCIIYTYRTVSHALTYTQFLILVLYRSDWYNTLASFSVCLEEVVLIQRYLLQHPLISARISDVIFRGNQNFTRHVIKMRWADSISVRDVFKHQVPG